MDHVRWSEVVSVVCDYYSQPGSAGVTVTLDGIRAGRRDPRHREARALLVYLLSHGRGMRMVDVAAVIDSPTTHATRIRQRVEDLLSDEDYETRRDLAAVQALLSERGEGGHGQDNTATTASTGAAHDPCGRDRRGPEVPGANRGSLRLVSQHAVPPDRQPLVRIQRDRRRYRSDSDTAGAASGERRINSESGEPGQLTAPNA